MTGNYPSAQIYYMNEHYTPLAPKFPVLDKLLEDYPEHKFHFIIGGLDGLCTEDITLTDSRGNKVSDVVWKPIERFAPSDGADFGFSDGSLSVNCNSSVFACTEAVYSPYEYTLSLKLNSAKAWFYFGLSVSGAEDNGILEGSYEHNYKSVMFIVPEKSSNRISFWDVQNKREWVINRADFNWGAYHSLGVKNTKEGNQFFLDGEPIADMGNDIPPHSRPCYELSYIYKGSGVMEVDGTEFSCSENTFIVTKPNEIHSFKGGAGCRLIYLGFFYDNSLGFFSQTFYDPSPTVKKLIVQLDYELKQRSCGFEEISGEYLKYLIITLLRAQKKINISVLDKTVAEISDKLCENIDPKMLLGNLGYSYHHLRHLFKQYSGLSLNRYVESARINRAMYLLRNTNQTIGEVAVNSGFDSMPKFKNSFVKITGMLPRVYRERECAALSLFDSVSDF